jgi:hypothetical protein
MSYKYHERAIVINERNLIRVFDVCFDGYCGGNDAQIMRWEKTNCEEFKQATENLSTPYTGASMLVMSESLPKHTNVYESFPNLIVWHPKTPHPSRMRVVPDKGWQVGNSLDWHSLFSHSNSAQVYRVYSMYFKMLDLNIDQYSQALDPGALAVANETDPYVFSFHGHMASSPRAHGVDPRRAARGDAWQRTPLVQLCLRRQRARGPRHAAARDTDAGASCVSGGIYYTSYT